jgi:aldehyde dehydrogenase (NAD+)
VASIWSEDINLALDLATQVKAGTIWINSTNQFDAASGFGGYRESGFGREGGREGLFEYVKRKAVKGEGAGVKGNGKAPAKATAAKSPVSRHAGLSLVPIDRTAKMFIGGKQARPDGGLSLNVTGPGRQLLGEVGAGNRKDIRNAVEAARAAAGGWAKATAHNRAQVLYFLAENLAARAEEFARRISQQTGAAAAVGNAEVDAAIAQLFTAAAWADKYDGRIHGVPQRNVTLAVNEPMGVLAILLPDDNPLLAFAALAAPALAMGNALVVVPSPAHPLCVTDLYQVLETSDVPHGTVNIVTGQRDELAKTLGEHEDVDAIWYAGPADGQAATQKASAANMKRTWVMNATGTLPPVDEVLREATQVKNIWVPYGA